MSSRTNGRRPKGLKSTYVRDLIFRDILRFFRASPQQHVSSLCSIEMTDSRFDLAYIELRLFYKSSPLITPTYRNPQGVTIPRSLQLTAADVIETPFSVLTFPLSAVRFHLSAFSFPLSRTARLLSPIRAFLQSWEHLHRERENMP